MALAQVWLDDPDGTFEKTMESAQKALDKRLISGAEMALTRIEATKCRDDARRFNEIVEAVRP